MFQNILIRDGQSILHRACCSGGGGYYRTIQNQCERKLLVEFGFAGAYASIAASAAEVVLLIVLISCALKLPSFAQVE